MSLDFNSLKKKKSNNLKEMAEKIESMNKGSGGKKDERIYKPGFDKKEGIGNAVVRLIPAKVGDNFVRQFSHSFKGSGGFYWENSRTTVSDEKDPVSISNGLHWKKGEDTGEEKYKNVARQRKRNTKYYFNVYVEKDQYNKECEGQVMIMECGPQIFKVIEDAISPKFEDDEAIDPFDLWGGAPLKIRAEGKEIPDKRTGNKVVVPNYEKSLFGRQGEFLDGDEDKMKEVFEQTHDLSDFVKIKTFDELAKRFKQVTGEDYDALDTTGTEDHVKEVEEDFKEQYNQNADEKEESDDGDEDPKEKSDETINTDDDDDDALLSEFERLANGG